VEHHGQKDILVAGQNRLTAFDARTHADLWRYGEGAGPFNGEIISSPVYGDGLVFLQLWRDTKIQAIRLTGKGKPPETVWVSKKPGPVESSLVYYRGLLYALMDNGVLVCLDGKTGDELYRERLGGACNSSPIASDGHVFLSNNDGKTFVVKAGREFRLRVDRTFVYSGPAAVGSPSAFGRVQLVDRINASSLKPFGRVLLPLSLTRSTNYAWLYGTVCLSPTIEGKVAKLEGRLLDSKGRVRKASTGSKKTLDGGFTLWTGSWELFDLPPGIYTLDLVATDKTGAVITSRTENVLHGKPDTLR
jgi:hypothetical protein